MEYGLKIKLKGTYGEIDAHLSKDVLVYRMGKEKNISEYAQAVGVLAELYQSMSICEKEIKK